MGFCASLVPLAAFAVLTAAHAAALDRRIEHPDGVSVVVKGIERRPDSIVVAVEIANPGDRAVTLDTAHSFLLTDGTHGVHHLNPPADNAELRIPAGTRLAGDLVFIGPLAPAATAVTLSANDGIGSVDNPYDETPVLHAVLPVAAGAAAHQADHPDGAALVVQSVTAYPGAIAVTLMATNGNEREIRLDQAGSLTIEADGVPPLALPAPDGNPTLAVPPGDRLTATLVFPGALQAGADRVTLSVNDDTGGTADNPYDTLPVFRLNLPVERAGGTPPAMRIALAPIAHSHLSAPVAVAGPGPQTTPQTTPPTTPAPVAAPPAAVSPPPVPASPAPTSPVAAPSPAPLPEVPPTKPAAPEPRPVPRPTVPVATMGLPQLKTALGAEPSDRGLRVVLPADTLFGGAGATLGDGGETALDEVARLVALTHPREIVVAGHTDGIGPDDANMTLSVQRARAVAAWLEAHDGHARPRIVEQGYGRTRPVAPNTNPDGSDNPAGRAQNRRIEILLQH